MKTEVLPLHTILRTALQSSAWQRRKCIGWEYWFPSLQIRLGKYDEGEHGSSPSIG